MRKPEIIYIYNSRKEEFNGIWLGNVCGIFVLQKQILHEKMFKKKKRFKILSAYLETSTIQISGYDTHIYSLLWVKSMTKQLCIAKNVK